MADHFWPRANMMARADGALSPRLWWRLLWLSLAVCIGLPAVLFPSMFGLMLLGAWSIHGAYRFLLDCYVYPAACVFGPAHFSKSWFVEPKDMTGFVLLAFFYAAVATVVSLMLAATWRNLWSRAAAAMLVLILVAATITQGGIHIKGATHAYIEEGDAKNAKSASNWAIKRIRDPLMRSDAGAVDAALKEEFYGDRIALAACVYDTNGLIVATFVRFGQSVVFPPVHEYSLFALTGKRLDMFNPIMDCDDGEVQVGTLFTRIATEVQVRTDRARIPTAAIPNPDYRY